MGLRDQLAGLPAIYINTPDATERRDAMLERVAPLVGVLMRLSAATGDQFTREEIRRYRARVNNEDPETKRILDRWVPTWGRTLACAVSHQRAVSMGLGLGWERFIVFEDDALPRLGPIDSAGPMTADISLLGWGEPQGRGFGTAMPKWARAEERGPSEWQPIAPGRDVVTGYPTRAHAYCLTRAGADAMAAAFLPMDGHSDEMWARAMADLGAERLSPPAFWQDIERFGSMRASRDPAVRG